MNSITHLLRNKGHKERRTTWLVLLLITFKQKTVVGKVP